MRENKVTKKWLQNHFAYSWWKYLLLITVSVMGISVLFTSTQYRAPEEKKIELFVLNDYVDAPALDAYLNPMFFAEYPEQEEFVLLNINLESGDMYAPMQYSTYVAAQQGDVFLISKPEADKISASGADTIFVELTPYIESGVIDPRGIKLDKGMMKAADGTTGLYGIPADALTGLEAYSNDSAGALLCMTVYGGNDDHAAAVIDMMIREFKPEMLEDTQEPAQAAVTEEMDGGAEEKKSIAVF